MFGNIGEIMGMLADPSKIAKKVRTALPKAFSRAVVRLAAESKVEAAQVGVMLWHGQTKEGPKLMATVFALDEFGAIVEAHGTTDVAAAFDAMSDAEIMQALEDVG